jgi:hypothetical protein
LIIENVAFRDKMSSADAVAKMRTEPKKRVMLGPHFPVNRANLETKLMTSPAAPPTGNGLVLFPSKRPK